MRYKTLLILLLLLLSACADPRPERFQTQRIGLFDTLIVFSGYAQTEEEFTRYAEIVFGRLEELHRLFDIFNEYDGLNNLYTVNAAAGLEPVRVHDDLIALLLHAKEAYDITGGTANAALGPVLRIWHEHRQLGTPPPEELLRQAAEDAVMTMAHVSIDGNSVFLPYEEMSLDVGSIAKGFAAGLAAEAAQAAGMEAVLLNAGGHIVAMGVPPGASYWTVGITNPDGGPPNTVQITDSAVSVSGGHLRYFEADGTAYGHIIDPATLRPAARYRQVTVVHPVSWKADALSTALFILPREEGEALAARFGAEVFYAKLHTSARAH